MYVGSLYLSELSMASVLCFSILIVSSTAPKIESSSSGLRKSDGFDTNEPMGIRITLNDQYIRNMDNSTVDMLRGLIAKHGVIVLQNSGEPLTSDDLFHFAGRFGDPISLPNGFGFNSTDQAHALESFVTNITNIDPVSGKTKTVSTAEYLHNDGDFWENNYIFSFLYGEVIPDIGGHTQFVDSQRAHDLLRDEHEDLYNVVDGEYVVIDVNDIPDFKGSPFLDKFNAEHGKARHPIISNHRVTGRRVLFYGCKHVEIEGFGVEKSAKTLNAIDDVLWSAVKEGGAISYVHEWRQNDLVIWDNTRVMHASLGGYESRPRKLWRVESRIVD